MDDDKKDDNVVDLMPRLGRTEQGDLADQMIAVIEESTYRDDPAPDIIFNCDLGRVDDTEQSEQEQESGLFYAVKTLYMKLRGIPVRTEPTEITYFSEEYEEAKDMADKVMGKYRAAVCGLGLLLGFRNPMFKKEDIREMSYYGSLSRERDIGNIYKIMLLADERCRAIGKYIHRMATDPKYPDQIKALKIYATLISEPDEMVDKFMYGELERSKAALKAALH
ncbi:MAG: hypothetical protein ABIG89_00270 [Candidatus Woesearchaeota archaeon]